MRNSAADQKTGSGPVHAMTAGYDTFRGLDAYHGQLVALFGEHRRADDGRHCRCGQPCPCPTEFRTCELMDMTVTEVIR